MKRSPSVLLKGLVFVTLVAALGWAGLQSVGAATRWQGMMGAGYYGHMGGSQDMTSGEAPDWNFSDEQWAEMGEFHAKIHGGDPAEAEAFMRDMHSWMGSMHGWTEGAQE